MLKRLSLLLLIFTMASCTNHYLYDPNDHLYTSTYTNTNHALVIYDSSYFIEGKKKQLQMHFINLDKEPSDRVNKKRNYDYFYDLINYPKKDQFYGLPEQYGLKAYVVEPGTYALANCESDASYDNRPNHCPPNFTKHGNTRIGHIFFQAKPGEVLCLGKFNLSRKEISLKEMADVDIENNCDQAKALLEKKYPNLVNKLENRSFVATKAEAPEPDNPQGNRIPDTFFMLQSM